MRTYADALPVRLQEHVTSTGSPLSERVSHTSLLELHNTGTDLRRRSAYVGAKSVARILVLFFHVWTYDRASLSAYVSTRQQTRFLVLRHLCAFTYMDRRQSREPLWDLGQMENYA